MTNTPTTTDETMTKKDFQAVPMKPIEQNGGMRLALSNFAEIEKFAHFMAISVFVPKHLRGKQADCLAVLLQSQRWDMDPFAVAQKTYFVNDGIGYEAQLVNAIIISKAPIRERPKISWDGEGDNLSCTVTATFIGETEPKSRTAHFRTITTKNSPLWKQDPQQQLAYFTLRAWARLYCPDVIMGVYTREEVESSPDHQGPDRAKDVTPSAEDVAASSKPKGSKLDQFADSLLVKTIEPIEDGDNLENGSLPAHDPETGELIEQEAGKRPESTSSEAQHFMRPLPAIIPMPSMAGDNTTPDIAAWAESWEEAVATAPDTVWLKDLFKKNSTPLNSFAKRNPEKHQDCLKYYEQMLSALSENVAA